LLLYRLLLALPCSVRLSLPPSTSGRPQRGWRVDGGLNSRLPITFGRYVCAYFWDAWPEVRGERRANPLYEEVVGFTGCRSDASDCGQTHGRIRGGLTARLRHCIEFARRRIETYQANSGRRLNPRGGRLHGRNNWPDGHSHRCRPSRLWLIDPAAPEQTLSPTPTPRRCRSVLAEGDSRGTSSQ
jgi:hypothetical protein